MKVLKQHLFIVAFAMAALFACVQVSTAVEAPKVNTQSKEAPKLNVQPKVNAQQSKETPKANTQKGELRGNSQTKVFHNSTCRYYNAKNSTVKFMTKEEATAAGYRPCKKCNK